MNMEITVDVDVCCSSGQCAVTAPQVFRMEGGRPVVQTDAGEWRDDAEEAADMCPVQAISVHG
jgi:ferredoxin